MTRRTHLSLLGAAATAGSVSVAIAKDNPSMFQQIFESSMTEKKGVTLYVKGQTIVGVVTKINADSIEMRSREFSRIVVKIDSIDAVTIA